METTKKLNTGVMITQNSRGAIISVHSPYWNEPVQKLSRLDIFFNYFKNFGEKLKLNK